MCDSRQPANGADSEPEYHAYDVKMRPAEGPSWWVRVPKAMGRHDAMNQARQQAYDEGEDASPIEVSAT